MVKTWPKNAVWSLRNSASFNATVDDIRLLVSLGVISSTHFKCHTLVPCFSFSLVSMSKLTRALSVVSHSFLIFVSSRIL